MKTRNKNKKNINIKKNKTFWNSFVMSYEVSPPSKRNLHERKFNVISISENKNAITVNRLVKCTFPDCQHKVRICKRYFIMNNIVHESFPKIDYDNKTLDNFFKDLPGNIPYICK